MARIGLFGGTFNPVHLGHLRAAREVAETLRLDRVYLIPSARPPHKPYPQIAPAADRLEMLRQAASDCPDFVVSDIEVARGGLSYSIDTLQAFTARMAPPSELFWIIGLDAFLEIHTWKNWYELLKSVAFVVMRRPHMRLSRPEDAVDAITAYLQYHLNTPYRFDSERTCFTHAVNPPVYLLNITMLDISGTMIRENIKKTRSIQFLVPPVVAHTIQKRGLYQ